MENLSEYELLRLANIQRNQQKLSEMGLVDFDLFDGVNNTAPPKKQYRKREAVAEPSRRSSRLQGVPAHPAESVVESSRPARAPRQEPAYSSTAERNSPDAPGAEHDEHNRLRLSTMRLTALSTRINRITNLGKLSSLIRVCEEDGHEELCELAQLRYQELTGSFYA